MAASAGLAGPAAGVEVVRLDDVSVVYRLFDDAHISLKEAIVRRRRPTRRLHPALLHLSLAVTRGEVLGVIGGNGAGKTTLLRVIARVLHPTSGRLRLRGHVTALIDLIGGFHPELTGRENVFLQGAILGASHEIMATRMDAIIDFAEIGEYMDAPLRTYSAGMMLRLAFSVLTSADSEILVIDEALGVGDAGFQQKCAARLADYRSRGAGIIVASHDLPRLGALADRVLWLDHGQCRALDAPGVVIPQYLQSLK